MFLFYQSVLWMHNGNILSPEDGQISVQNSHPELTCINYLHFTNIGAGDEGIYECLDVDSIDDHHALRQLLLASEGGGGGEGRGGEGRGGGYGWKIMF